MDENYNIENLIMSFDIMTVYYAINLFWVCFNLFVILPFFTAFIFRLKNPSSRNKLWTDHLSRLGLILTLLFYAIDTIVKVYVDGSQSICQKSMIMHHVASFFIMMPLIINEYIPWWVNPVGFIHGYIVFFDDHIEIQYIYGIFMLFFQYMLYQRPYRDMKLYWVTRIAINYVWVFILTYKLGQCSNYLPTEPDHYPKPEEGILF